MRPVRKPIERLKARELRLEGWTVKEIAKEVGAHHDTVRKWVKDLPSKRHHLSDIDEEHQEGTCIHCGRTKLRKNGKEGARWLCGTWAKAASERSCERALQKFYEYLCTQRCTDCSNEDPIVLEFDHIGDDKQYNISDMVRKGYKWATILTEIQKCEVVCANCHRIRTNQRGNWYRHSLSLPVS